MMKKVHQIYKFLYLYLPKNPTELWTDVLMAPFVSESRLALRAHAHADVPMRYSSTMFQPIRNAINSPTVT